MGKIRVRHLVPKPSGYYFQATPKMRLHGIESGPLGKDPVAAMAEADRRNQQWDSIKQHLKEYGRAPAPSRYHDGTLNHLYHDKLKKSAEWDDKGERTKEEIEYAFKIISEIFGDSHILTITPEDCIDYYKVARGKFSIHKCAKIMKWFRYLFGYAMKTRYSNIKDNPTLAVKVKQPNARDTLWTEDQVWTLIEKAWEMEYYGAAVAVLMAYDTSLRPGDIRTLKRKQRDAESLSVVTKKTNKAGRLPLYPETQDLIDFYWRALGIDHHPEAWIIIAPSGRPYSKDLLAKHIRIIRKAAKLPEHLQLRDIRRTGSSERALAGASAFELASSTIHSIEHGSQILDIYNPLNYDAAVSAQEKRKIYMEDQRKQNASGTELPKKFESAG